MLLHWSTDPLLLDEKPIKYNDWETANTLIQKEGLETVLKKNLSFKNLYGIMVRKIDFVRTKSSDRIIARFPFLILTEQMKEVIRKDILLMSEAVRDYFYQSINKSIMQWKTIILNYLEKGSLPFPIFRCCFELEPNLHALINETFLRFTSACGEAFTFPTKLTNKLAYLCGICNGDGNLRDYWIIIADETKEHIEFISNMLNELFSKKGKLMKTGGAWIVKLNLLWAVRMFNFLTDQAIDEPKYDSLREPVIFQQLGEPFRNLYWRGVFDADGSFKNQIVFCSMSEAYSKDFQNYLTENGIVSNFFTKTDGGYQVNILAKDKINFADLIGSIHPKKQKDFLNFMQKSIQKFEFQGFKKETITHEGYFDFKLLTTVSVIGLNEYFIQLSSKNTSFNNRDLKLYQTHTGITIGRLVKHMNNVNQKIMLFLDKYKNNISFRSFSSEIIKLPLQPSEILHELMEHFIPTARGATLYNSSTKLLNLREMYFAIPKDAKLELTNKLLRRFLTTFGNYSQWSINAKEYIKKWQEIMEK